MFNNKLKAIKKQSRIFAEQKLQVYNSCYKPEIETI